LVEQGGVIDHVSIQDADVATSAALYDAELAHVRTAPSRAAVRAFCNAPVQTGQPDS
jgi:hypothetical protein